VLVEHDAPVGRLDRGKRLRGWGGGRYREHRREASEPTPEPA
jgi:hypothetical protein